MIYIVTGFTRSGTSMMMNCLIAGGMTAEYVEGNQREAYYIADEGYHPNQQGYRQLDVIDIKRPDFPECFDGKLIKMPIYWWTGSRGYGGRKIEIPYKAIFMRRDWQEQILSRRRLDDHVNKRKDGRLIPSREPIYREIVPEVIANAKTYDEVWYPIAVFNPLPVFEMLKDHGWPIDPEQAAEVPNPKLRHYNIKG
ncbi:MAG: hypothetical protein SVT56_04875 [Chloroflexota bacterium]|nr:hypothetical protein [Chloroflexota bacterium]